MKTNRINCIAVLSAASLIVVEASAATYSFTGLNLDIPDGDSSGLANTQIVNAGPVGTLTDVNVILRLSGLNGDGFNGDLYAWLRHGTGFSVLLNRPGSTVADASGYGDSGLFVTLDDGAGEDVHSYRNSLAGPFPLANVSGTYQPDGRTADPGIVVDTDIRGAMLGSMNGLDPNGEWTLFVSDLSSGGALRLDGWGLQLSFSGGNNVPDSGNMLIPFLLATTLMGVFLGRGQSSARK